MNKSVQKLKDSKKLTKLLWIPLFAWFMFLVKHHYDWFFLSPFAILALILVVIDSVHHSEIISHKVGEPFGALVLAVSVTVIEVAIIISFMSTGTQGIAELARDTVFAAVMIILTGMAGLTLLIGGIKFKEQSFSSQGVTSLLTILVTISVLTLILPNYTVAVAGPYYSVMQLGFVALVTFFLYTSFLFVQNFKHRNHFINESEFQEVIVKPDTKKTITSLIFLPIDLLVVVMLAESLAPDLETFIQRIGAPVSLSGIIIACVILLPEGISAVKAASKNQIQKSLNLSLGSALASISLTIPAVAIYSIFTNKPIALGINSESSALFILSLFVLTLSLVKGKTTILQGIILLILFAVYLFLSLVP